MNLIAILLLSLSPSRVEQTQQVPYMVWDKTCLRSIEIGERTRLEAPLKEDGTPDFMRAKLKDVVVDFDHKCGRIDIRKIPVEVKQ